MNRHSRNDPPPGRSNAAADNAIDPPAIRRRQPSRPPYNPGLQKLVKGKKAWTEPLSDEATAQGFLGWHQRGYIPHCDFPDVTQFVTLRLDDSMPASRRSEWEALLHLEDKRERRTKLEEYLDRGFGECPLKQPAIAELAENALRFFDGQRYRVQAWVIMPNHIHVLVDIWQTPLAEIDKSWKQFIARKANRLLGCEGRLWEREYWDMVIEDEEHRRKSVRYIEANPVKALFVREARDWGWSSARWRDEYGRLPEPDCISGAPVSQPALRER
jgi:REP element-mobilizing transposase RayT